LSSWSAATVHLRAHYPLSTVRKAGELYLCRRSRSEISLERGWRQAEIHVMTISQYVVSISCRTAMETITKGIARVRIGISWVASKWKGWHPSSGTRDFGQICTQTTNFPELGTRFLQVFRALICPWHYKEIVG
jgi:hypothetical protein